MSPITKKIYHLSTCDTCKRIIKEANLDFSFEHIDIKTIPIDATTLDHLAITHGSYENLFNKRARKYSSLGYNHQSLTDLDYRKLILEEYTFLKRPVVILGDKSFVGNSKKTVKALIGYLEELNG